MEDSCARGAAYYAAIRDPDLWDPVRSFSVFARRLILPGLRVIYDIIAENCKPRRVPRVGHAQRAHRDQPIGSKSGF
jgi:hypothetical protein